MQPIRGLLNPEIPESFARQKKKEYPHAIYDTLLRTTFANLRTSRNFLP